jgi:hypothetical protein
MMEAGTADRTKLAEKKKDGPSRAMPGRSCSRYSMSRTMWASRHDLLVIPGITDQHKHPKTLCSFPSSFSIDLRHFML